MTTPAVPNSGELEQSAPLAPEVEAILRRARKTGRYLTVNPFLQSALDADTLEAATQMVDVISGQEHLNERIRFIDVTFLNSDPELGSDVPIFAVCDVAREMGDGVIEKMSIGAGQVVGVMIRAAEMDWFPFDAELVAVGLGTGKKAINLQLSPKRVDNDADF